MNNAPHTAVILAGGSSSFNGFSIAACPKALLPIANVPSYRYLARVLGAVGVKRLIFCVRPGMGAVVEEHLPLWPVPMESQVIETSHGTGGSVKGAEAWLEGAPFWVVGGDLFLGMGLDQMLEAHRSQEAIATVGSLPVLEAAWEKERVELDAENGVKAIHRIHHMQEKRSMHRPAGLYLFEPAILKLLPAGSYFDLKEQLFPILYERGLPARIWEIQQYCRTISSLDDYFFANLDVLARRVLFPGINDAVAQPQTAPVGNVPWKLFEPVAMGPHCRLADEVLILGPTAIGPRCEVGKGAIINECVILGDTLIGQGSYLSRCVIGEGSIVRNGTILHETALIKSPSGEKDVDVLPLRKSTFRDPQSVVKHLHWQTPAGPVYLKVKRIVDFMAAALGLIITAPLMFIIAVAIKLESPGNVFFRQPRCGLRGSKFVMYKFRSMVSNSEELKRELQQMNEVDGPMFKISRDPRVTRVGKFLRDTNLDELPQLWNVLKGDMSLVGTRPLTLEEMRYNPRWRDARLSVRPGITGLWQVEAHSKLQFNYWILHDLDYAQNISPGLDLKILGKTGYKVVRDFIRVVKGKDCCIRAIAIVLVSVLLSLAMMACGPGGKGTGVRQVAYPEMKPPPPGPVEVGSGYRILKGDTLSLNFARNSELNIATAMVRPDGKIALALAGDVTAFGMTLPELRAAISCKYQDFIARTRYDKRFKEGDYFDLRFVYNPELNIGARIQSDGKVILPIAGEIQAAGYTPEELRQVLIKRYSRDIRNPDIAILVGVNPMAFPSDIAVKKIHAEPETITVALTKTAGDSVFVGGEVSNPIAVKWSGYLTTLQAIAAAGGKKETGDLSRVVILRRGQFDQTEWIQTDLASPLTGKDIKNDIPLLAGDIVLVPMSGIAKLNLWVKQYIRDLTPIPGGYSINLGGATALGATPLIP